MRFDIKPSELMVPIVQKLSKNLGISADPDNYCLKVVGRQEYIIGDYPLHRFTVSSRNGISVYFLIPSLLVISDLFHFISIAKHQTNELSFYLEHKEVFS